MEAEGSAAAAAAAARNAKESLELAFQMSEILGTGLDRHTLSLLIALCDRGLNPEALAALVRELSPPPSSASASASASAPAPAPASASAFAAATAAASGKSALS